MWSKLQTIITQGLWAFLVGSTTNIIRLFIIAAVTGIGMRAATKWDVWLAPLWANLATLLPAYDFSLASTAYNYANAWLPVSECMIAIAGLWTFRAIHATIKVVQEIWEAVPLN